MSDFYSALGDDAEAYFLRNGGKIDRQRDPVLEAVRLVHSLKPVRRVLEIGCSTGWRLEEVRRETGAVVVGLEASHAAVERGRIEYPKVQLVRGVAPRDLGALRSEGGDDQFDCVIVGFVEYLIPRSSLFHFAAEVDGLLRDDGHLIVFDFLSPHPVSRGYSHDSRLSIFKLDPSQLWTWSPTYCLIGRELFLAERTPAHFIDVAQWMAVDTIRKLSESSAYPLAP